MPRELASAAETALAGSHVIDALLVELEFPSGTVRFNTSSETIAWSGNTYLGAGAVSAIEPVQESVAPVAAALAIRFTGLDPAYVSAMLNDNWQGEPGRIYLALWDTTTVDLVSDPVLLFEGEMDEPVIEVGQRATLQVTLENVLGDWDRPRLRRYSHADQTARYSGDLFFEFAEELQSKDIVWGIYKGPVAPDPLKVFNRTLDRVLGSPLGKIATRGLGKPALNAARKVGDALGNVFGW